MDAVVSSFLVGVVVTIVGGLLLAAIVNSIRSRPLLSYSIVFSEWLPSDKGFFATARELLEEARKNETDLVPDLETAFRLHDSASAATRLFQLGITNKGSRGAENVTVVLSDEPYGFIVEPKVKVTRSSGADGSIAFDVAAVPKRDQVRLTFFGVTSSNLNSVSYGGEAVSRQYGKIVEETDAVRKVARSTAFVWIIWAFTAGLWIAQIAESALNASQAHEDTEQTSEDEGAQE